MPFRSRRLGGEPATGGALPHIALHGLPICSCPPPSCPQLVELSQPLSPAMALIYESISELMDACVKELRKYNRLDASDLTVEQVGCLVRPHGLQILQGRI